MLRYFLLLVLSFDLLAASKAFIPYYDFQGPSTVIAGSRTMFWIRPTHAFDATVNASTDVFTADSSYTPANGDLVRAQTTGTLPTGMYGMVDQVWAVYVLTNASGQTFKLCEAAGQIAPPGTCTGSTLNVTDTGTGTLTLMFSEQATNTNIYVSPPTGFPASTIFDYEETLIGYRGCGPTAPPIVSGKYHLSGQESMCVNATVPAGATPGTSTVTFTVCDDSACTTPTDFTWSIQVIAPQTVTYTPPSSFTTPSALTYWEQVMTNRPCPAPGDSTGCGNPGDPVSAWSGPANFCDPLASPSPVNSLGAATSATVSYYGWGLLFDNMAIYTGNTVYRTGCFQTGMGHSGSTDLVSVRKYVTDNGGNVALYAHFAEGLFRAGTVFSDSTYTDAGLLLQNATVTKYGPQIPFEYQRENTYALDDCVALYKYGAYTCPRWNDHRDMVYSSALRFTESDASGQRFPNQQFILGGLSSHAIIADWQLTSDPRALYMVKRINDYVWSKYDQTTHIMMNLEGPDGSPWCASTAIPWFLPVTTGNCGLNTYRDTQMLLAQAFWWYYAMTGDTTYRDRGDDIALHFFDGGGFGGKQSSQGYYNSFNAFAWRTGAMNACQWYGDGAATNPTCDAAPSTISVKRGGISKIGGQSKSN